MYYYQIQENCVDTHNYLEGRYQEKKEKYGQTHLGMSKEDYHKEWEQEFHKAQIQ